MMKCLVGALALAQMMIAGCKGETVYKDSPDTLARIEQCQNETEQKKKLITMLEGQVGELKTKGAGDEIFVTMDGEIEVKAAGSSSRKPATNVNVEEQAKAFYKHVSTANAAVRRCYQNALKKDSSLTARVIKLNVKVSYATSGQVADVAMDKKISDNFAGCLEGIASRWKVPPPPKRVTFSQTFALTPQ